MHITIYFILGHNIGWQSTFDILVLVTAVECTCQCLAWPERNCMTKLKGVNICRPYKLPGWISSYQSQSKVVMNRFWSLLICLVLLSVICDAKKPKPIKPIRPPKPFPNKPPKPVPTKPPKPIPTKPPKPTPTEIISANAKFDEIASASLPGCLVCLKLYAQECIIQCFQTPEKPEECLDCIITHAVQCLDACGKC